MPSSRCVKTPLEIPTTTYSNCCHKQRYPPATCTTLINFAPPCRAAKISPALYSHNLFGSESQQQNCGQEGGGPSNEQCRLRALNRTMLSDESLVAVAKRDSAPSVRNNSLIWSKIPHANVEHPHTVPAEIALSSTHATQQARRDSVPGRAVVLVKSSISNSETRQESLPSLAALKIIKVFRIKVSLAA